MSLGPESSKTREIPITKGLVAIVDEIDYERLNQYKWYAQSNQNGQYRACAYLRYNSVAKYRRPYKRILIHRLILDAKEGQEVDHINHNSLDNRRCNLRFCTHGENMRNQLRNPRISKSSQYKGVNWDSTRNKWHVKIMLNYKSIFVGRFDSETEAAEAYDISARKLFGEFAHLNFPKEVSLCL